MLDILQLRISLDEFDQLRLCQATQRNDCHAAFTVRGASTIWPIATWDEPPMQERINVRGWFPLLDKIADEFLIFRPAGGCFFVSREGVRYRVEETDPRGVLFMELEIPRPMAVPQRQTEPVRAFLMP